MKLPHIATWQAFVVGARDFTHAPAQLCRVAVGSDEAFKRANNDKQTARNA